MSTHAILFFQNFFALMLLIPLVSIHPEVLKTKKIPLIILRSFFGILTYYFLFLAIKLIPLVDAAVLNNTAPLFIPFILLFWIKKPISKRQLLGILAGFIGVVLILKPGTEIFSFGSIVALLAGLFAALTQSTVRLLSSESPITIIVYYLCISFVVILPFLWIDWQMPTTEIWLLLILSGIFMYFTQVFFTQAYRYACASDLGPFTYSFVIIAGLLDWFIWKNIPSLISFIGIFLIILGGILTIIFSKSSTEKIEK